MRLGLGWLWMGVGICVLAACAPSVADVPVPTASPPPPALPVLRATFTPGPALSGETVSGVGAEAPGSAEATGTSGPVAYTVQPGDVLFDLALRFDVPMAAIQLQNDLGGSTVVKVGETLWIPPPVGWEGASPFWVIHEVAEGEVLSTIAARYGLDVATLQAVNGLTDADLITVGQPLVLPLDAPAEVVAAAHMPTPTPVPPTDTPLPPTATPLLSTATPTDTEGALTPAATPSPQPTPVESPAEPPADIAEFPAEVFRLINVERAAHGLAPYRYNTTLAHAAQLHAEDCYARGWCGHTGSDGSTMKARIIRAGYDPARWSECWAWYSSPAGAVAAWMDETPPNDPHRRTLLSTWLTEVGIGVVPGNGHGYYFIADFGTPRE